MHNLFCEVYQGISTSISNLKDSDELHHYELGQLYVAIQERVRGKFEEILKDKSKEFKEEFANYINQFNLSLTREIS